MSKCKRALEQLRHNHERLRDHCRVQQRTINAFKEVVTAARCAAKRDAKLLRAVLKGKAKRDSLKRRLAGITEERDSLIEALRNVNQWLAASRINAEHYAILGGLKIKALEDKSGMLVREESPRMDYGEMTNGDAKAFRRG